MFADKVSKQPTVASTYPRKEFIPYKPGEPKASVPTILDVVEQMKKSLTNVSLWDLLSSLEIKNRLKEALSDIKKSASGNATKAL